MSARRRVAGSLLFGALHAAILVLVALELGYAIGPSDYALPGVIWRYGGLVVVAAVPMWLALRFRLVTPLAAVLAVTGYVLWMEVTPPGPTFTDVAELERLDEPTGIMVVEDGLYIVRYMVNASVWLVGAVFAGLVEYVVRTRWRRVPPVRNPVPWIRVPAPRREAFVGATIGGVLHAAAMTWFAYRLGVTLSGVVAWVMFGVSAVGMWLLAAIPTYLLLRHRVLLPAALLTALVFLDVRAEFTAGPADPHALYFFGWFLYLGVLLVAAGVEYGLRNPDVIRSRIMRE